jgi:Lactonase, 7-bladed beta-propeller
MPKITIQKTVTRQKEHRLLGRGLLSVLFFCCILIGIVPATYAQDGDAQIQDSQWSNARGAVFAMTNRAKNNEVIAFRRSVDGTLTQTGRYSTGGNGIGVDFDTQGGLTLSREQRYLYACNPGSDEVSVFTVNGSNLSLIQRVYAGDQPLSISLSGDLAYVLDGSVAGNGIIGFVCARTERSSQFQIHSALSVPRLPSRAILSLLPMVGLSSSLVKSETFLTFSGCNRTGTPPLHSRINHLASGRLPRLFVMTGASWSSNRVCPY